MKKRTVNIDAEFDLPELSQQIEGVVTVVNRIKIPWIYLPVSQRRLAIANSASIQKLQALKLKLLELDLDV